MPGQTNRKVRWAEVLGFICGAFSAYTFEHIWTSVEVENVTVLYQQAKLERKRREVEGAHAALYAATDSGLAKLNALERNLQ